MSGRKIPNFELKSAIYARKSVMKYKNFGDSFKLDKPYPYIVIGNIFGGSWDAKNEPGMEPTVRFDCWSNRDTEEEVSDMMQDVIDAVGLSNDSTTTHLTLTNWDVVAQFLDSTTTVKDLDDKGPLRHGILDIRFVLRQK